ncbi:MAG TPA: hypothetical protein VGN17_02135 [Bryobacteraceae bacterium]|jgi:hypothetical protein
MGIPPYTDSEGKVWLTLTEAERVIEHVTDQTLRVWCKRGRTPWGLHLEVLRLPTLHNDRHPPPPTRIDSRVFISRDSVLLLKELLADHRPEHPNSRLTKDDLDHLETRTRLLLKKRRVAANCGVR